jgi:hypothetical protein
MSIMNACVDLQEFDKGGRLKVSYGGEKEQR